MNLTNCSVALKEWAVTCLALAQGRQVVLLRKGGILDDDGVFTLEHPAFWLMPTYEHQDVTLVQPAHRDLFTLAGATREPGENKQFLTLRCLAVAKEVYALTLDDEDRLRAVEHIWSGNYLDLRFGYKPEHPLLCVVLRVYENTEPVRVPMQDRFNGCRSWIELDAPLDCDLRPVLDDAAFKTRLEAVRQALTST